MPDLQQTGQRDKETRETRRQGDKETKYKNSDIQWAILLVSPRPLVLITAERLR